MSGDHQVATLMPSGTRGAAIPHGCSSVTTHLPTWPRVLLRFLFSSVTTQHTHTHVYVHTHSHTRICPQTHHSHTHTHTDTVTFTHTHSHHSHVYTNTHTYHSRTRTYSHSYIHTFTSVTHTVTFTHTHGLCLRAVDTDTVAVLTALWFRRLLFTGVLLCGVCQCVSRRLSSRTAGVSNAPAQLRLGGAGGDRLLVPWRSWLSTGC